MVILYTVSEIKDILKIRLSKKRYTHSINVADSAAALAKEYGFDREKCFLAGLVHDICKELPKEEQLEMVRKSNREITEEELVTPPLFHAPAGAYYAQRVLGISDEDILNAIRYHTVGRAGMCGIEKAVYIADLISEDRNYKDIDDMRKIAFEDINEAILKALKFNIEDVMKKNSRIPAHTINAYNEYISLLFSKERIHAGK